MIQKRYLFFALTLFAVSCKSLGQNPQKVQLSDNKATIETKNLFQNLNKLKEKGFMFGHQDDLAYGVNWKYEAGRSDVKDVTGDYPAIYGWDLGGLENNSENNLDEVPFKKMKQYIKDVYDRGGVNTISWHQNNPLTGKDSWDTTPNSLASVLPNGEKHEKFNEWLDKSAKFFLSLKGSDGKLIPILYRPYHELTGTWFWWCQNNASPEEFKTLWKYTVNYLKKKGVHNLIYVYNTSDFKTKEDFLKYYPGNDYADILSFDTYQYEDPTVSQSFEQNVNRQFSIIDEVATENNKLIAFAETGYEQIPYNKWWTETLMNAIGKYKISFVVAWRNHGYNEHMTPPKMHYYVPYKGHPNEQDFIDFYNLKETLFQSEVTKEKLYKK